MNDRARNQTGCSSSWKLHRAADEMNDDDDDDEINGSTMANPSRKSFASFTGRMLLLSHA